MPEEAIGDENSVSQPVPRKRSERTKAKFFEDADKIIAEVERLGTEYKPPSPTVFVTNLKAKPAEADSNSNGEALDNLMYLDDDSLMNGCISAKGYIKSKYGTTGQSYKNIAKMRFELPLRLRKK